MGKRSTIKQKIAAWTAIFAVLLMVLAPTLSRALSSASSESSASNFWMEICSAYSGKKADAPASGNDQLATSEKCPYCVMHADVLTPTPGVAVNETFFTISHLLPRLFYRAPQPLFAWTVASSRAPPAAA